MLKTSPLRPVKLTAANAKYIPTTGLQSLAIGAIQEAKCSENAYSNEVPELHPHHPQSCYLDTHHDLAAPVMVCRDPFSLSRETFNHLSRYKSLRCNGAARTEGKKRGLETLP